MATASATLQLAIPANQVWALIGGFNSLPDWLPFIAESIAGEGGRLRHLRTVDGAVIIERLERFDNAARSVSYSIVEGPFPASDYLATLTVEALGADRCQVTWGGQFQPVGISDAEVQALFQGVYDGGLAALQAHYSAKG